MPLELIRHQKVYIQAMNQIRNAIIRGEYKVGDKLPTESELSKIFQISRPSVREALSGLAALGLIEAKAGGGNYVKSANSSTAVELILEEEGNPLEILEARKIIEPEVAKFAARRREKEDLVAMEQSIKRARTINLDDSNKPIDEVISADAEIHLSFAQATHNNVLVAIVERLIGYMKQRGWKELQKLVKEEPRLVRKYLVEHEAICKSIRGRQPIKASRQMRDHLKGITEDLLKEVKNEPRNGSKGRA